MEQSKKLAEILPLGTADMRYSKLGFMHPWFNEPTLIEVDAIPCWSLAALINILASNTKQVRIEGSSEHWFCEPLFADIHKYSGFMDADNLVDACFDMIIRLRKKNLI